MNFFKKVMTLFSTLWNVILWRKIDKKARQVSKYAKEENQSQNDSITVTEKLFVDVPLHSSVVFDLYEQEELLVHDKAPATVDPVAAHTVGPISNSVVDRYSEAKAGEECVLVSSIQSKPDTDNPVAEYGSSRYSTNYMVKSDSLVNFLPECESDPSKNDVADISQVLLDTAVNDNNNMIPEREKEIPLLKEGCLEEVMCSPRGILKLSGDHHIDPIDENDGLIDDPKESHVKAAVDEFLVEAFLCEEPLQRAHYFEGFTLETPILECAIAEGTPFFPEIKRTELEDSEKIEDLGEPHLDDIETDAISRCITIMRTDSNMRVTPDRSRKHCLNDCTDVDLDEKKDEPKSLCVMTQLTTLNFDDESSPREGLERKELQVTKMRALLFGEEPTSDILPGEREKSPHPVQEEDANATMRDVIDSMNKTAFRDEEPGWQMALPLSELEKVAEIHNQNPSTSFPSLTTFESSIQVDTQSHSQDFYPFTDCSSYLFRIPEEIRKETSFNPCVGTAPSRRPGCHNAGVEPAKFDAVQDDVHDQQCPNINSSVPKLAQPVPLINPCDPDKASGLANLPNECYYNQGPLCQNVGKFWGARPGMVHHPGDQPHAVVGFPVSCNEKYYGEHDLSTMPTAGRENHHSQTTVYSDPETYSYINTYGTIGFPTLDIPFCTPQLHPPLMPRGTLPPMIFPITPVSLNQNLSSLVNPGTTNQDEQYPISHRLWEGSATTALLQNHEDGERNMAPVFEVRGFEPIENISTGTNDDDDDGDIGSNPIPGSHFQLEENNSLHSVKSKVDSYASSLFCESLRSIISHNTENENIFPSFSCSSVQGCYPSVLMQSCEATLSNDSLSSIVVAETSNCNKCVDDDYLATEKFMNDVNTALNESVMGQIQGQVDLHSNLGGRGDGSMAIGHGRHENYEDHGGETWENDGILRNSLGENISINNSKLTLLEGVLRTESGGSLPNRIVNLSTEMYDERLNSMNYYCRQVLDSLLENIFIAPMDYENTAELHFEMAPGMDATYGRNLDEPHIQTSPERDLIVQNMMFIEDMTESVRQMWSQFLKDGKLEELADNSVAFAFEDIQNRPGRYNRRKMKKLSYVESENEVETCVPGVTIGDGIRAPQGPLTEPNRDKAKNEHSGSSKPEENDSSLAEEGRQQFAKGYNEADFTKSETNFDQIGDQGHLHQEEEDEPCGNSGSPSNNRRRRNRRRKRKR